MQFVHGFAQLCVSLWVCSGLCLCLIFDECSLRYVALPCTALHCILELWFLSPTFRFVVEIFRLALVPLVNDEEVQTIEVQVGGVCAFNLNSNMQPKFTRRLRTYIENSICDECIHSTQRMKTTSSTPLLFSIALCIRAHSLHTCNGNIYIMKYKHILLFRLYHRFVVN